MVQLRIAQGNFRLLWSCLERFLAENQRFMMEAGRFRSRTGLPECLCFSLPPFSGNLADSTIGIFFITRMSTSVRALLSPGTNALSVRMCPPFMMRVEAVITTCVTRSCTCRASCAFFLPACTGKSFSVRET